ncbi:MAG: ATP-dependent sacrificial sulfur transferase LarE [Thermoguttaceae bacterium]
METRLLNWFKPFNSCVVAFSGGLDSSVVAKAAQLALGNKAVAVTAYSPSSFENEPKQAASLAEFIGVKHILIESDEFTDEDYLRNDKMRCYFCKKIRFRAITKLAEDMKIKLVLDGSNADDSSDFRPGKQAANELDVRSPLAELGISKEQARDIARKWGLPNWNKPALPCLSTRVAYGQKLSADILRKIEKAETELIHLLGSKHSSCQLGQLRVRIHGDTLVRIEVPTELVESGCVPEIRERIVTFIKELGFTFVTVDLQGFRSGSMNQLGLR